VLGLGQAQGALVLIATNKTFLALLCELAVPAYCLLRASAPARLARTATLGFVSGAKRQRCPYRRLSPDGSTYSTSLP